jgi:spermidine/putrescine transport system substrate-binding protein
MTKGAFSFYASRVAIVILWLGLIASFLYSPYISQFFSSSKSINIYTWADMLDADSILEFESQTGIKVNLSYYDNNEELLTKLKISKGRGYDLLVAVDYGIGNLIKLDLLKPVDKSKLNFWHELEPKILNKRYDPGNIYTVPFYWDIYGIGINIENFGGKMPPNSWSVALDPKVAQPNIGMVDDGLESVLIASQYLYGNIDKLNKEQLTEIKQILINQKKFVEAYTDLRGDYLLISGSSPAVVSQRAYIYRAMTEDERIKFIIPDEGSFIIVDNMVLPKASAKSNLAYQFINFMYQKRIVEKFVDEFAFLPMRKDVLGEMDLDYLGGKDKLLNPERFAKYAFFRHIASRAQIGKLWIEVKAS